MTTREQRLFPALHSLGRFRRVNFGRNDTKLFLKNPGYLRKLREADRRIDAGLGVRKTVDELRASYGIAP